MLGDSQAPMNTHPSGSQAATRDGHGAKYPEDPYGQEMGSTARVWNVSNDETALYDLKQTKVWVDSLDALLLFVGLFSAVVTAFLSQTYLSLQQDFTRITAALLVEQIALTRAADANIPLSSIPRSSYMLDAPASISITDLWTNRLWFASLTISLSTAFFSIVMKQWIANYPVLLSESGLQRARTRQLRSMEWERWGVRALFGALPMLVHTSLFLFLAGLSVFISSLDLNLAIFTATISAFIILLYVCASVSPVFSSRCPYKTPVAHFSNFMWRYLHLGTWKIRLMIRKAKSAIRRKMACQEISLPFDSASASDQHPHPYSTLDEKESQLVHRSSSKLDAEVVLWLWKHPSSTTAIEVALEALSGVDPDVRRVKDPRLIETLETNLGRCFVTCTGSGEPAMQVGMARKAERIARALIQVDGRPSSLQARQYFRSILLHAHSEACTGGDLAALRIQLAAVGQAFLADGSSLLEDGQTGPGPTNLMLIRQVEVAADLQRLSLLSAALLGEENHNFPSRLILRLLLVTILECHSLRQPSGESDSLHSNHHSLHSSHHSHEDYERFTVRTVNHFVNTALDSSFDALWSSQATRPKYTEQGAVDWVTKLLAVDCAHKHIVRDYDPIFNTLFSSYYLKETEELINDYTTQSDIRSSRKLVKEIAYQLLAECCRPDMDFDDRNKTVVTLSRILAGESVTQWPKSGYETFWRPDDDLEELQRALVSAQDLEQLAKDPMFLDRSRVRDCRRISRSLTVLLNNLLTSNLPVPQRTSLKNTVAPPAQVRIVEKAALTAESDSDSIIVKQGDDDLV